MAANWELQLISSIIRNENRSELFLEATNKGLTSSNLGNPEAKAIWSYLALEYNRPGLYGMVPSEDRLREHFQNIDLPDPQECFEDLCSLVIGRWQKRKTDRAWEDYLEGRRTNPGAALSKLTSVLMEIQEQDGSRGDVSFSDVALHQTAEDMTRLLENDGATGIPYPWPVLTDATGGINEGDFILIYALPKSMKTWIGLFLAVHVAMTGRKVLVYSREMTWDVVRRRIGCIIARVDYTKYKTNTLTEDERQSVLDAIEWFCKDCTGEIIFTDAERTDGSPGGPDEIRRKIETYNPQFALLDSAYMLELPQNTHNPYDWKSMALVNRRLKQICKKTLVSMVAILQENERAAYTYRGTRGTASLAMNTSAIQDCDLAMRAVYNKVREEISLHLPAARETTLNGFTINAKAATDFSYAHDRLWELGDGEEQEGGANNDADTAGVNNFNDSVNNLFSMVNSYREVTPTETSDGEPVPG